MFRSMGKFPASALYNKGSIVVGYSTASSGAASSTVSKPAGVINGDLLIAAILTKNTTIPVPSGWNAVSYRAPWSNGTGRSMIVNKIASGEPNSYVMKGNAVVLIALRYLTVYTSGQAEVAAGVRTLALPSTVPGTFRLAFYATRGGTNITLTQTGGVKIVNVSGSGAGGNLNGFFVGAALYATESVSVTANKNTSDVFHADINGLV